MSDSVCSFTYHRCPDLPGVELLEARATPGWRWYLTRFVWIVPATWDGEVLCHRRTHRLVPGTALYADPDGVCRSTGVSRAGQLSALFIDASWIDAARASRATGKTGRGATTTEPLDLHAGFAAFSQMFRSGARGDTLAARLTPLLETLDGAEPRLIRCTPSGLPRGAVAERLRALLQADPRRERSVECLADGLGMTRFQALRAFKQHFGLTPSEYQMSLRIAGAQAALRSGATPAEAAADFAFSDQSHFGRHFKRVVGRQPGALRAGRRRQPSMPPSPHAPERLKRARSAAAYSGAGSSSALGAGSVRTCRSTSRGIK